MVSEKLRLYRECMKSVMKQKFESKIERWKAMCVGAKICSKKVKDKKEALEMCLKAHPEWK